MHLQSTFHQSDVSKIYALVNRRLAKSHDDAGGILQPETGKFTEQENWENAVLRPQTQLFERLWRAFHQEKKSGQDHRKTFAFLSAVALMFSVHRESKLFWVTQAGPFVSWGLERIYLVAPWAFSSFSNCSSVRSTVSRQGWFHSIFVCLRRASHEFCVKRLNIQFGDFSLGIWQKHKLTITNVLASKLFPSKVTAAEFRRRAHLGRALPFMVVSGWSTGLHCCL